MPVATLSGRFRLGALAIALLLLPVSSAVAAGPVVSVTGGDVRGAQSSADASVITFKGIPYAADTAGKNRFRAPQPVSAWTTTFDASHYGPICPGFGGLPPPGAPEAPEGHDPNLTAPSEDCLRLNVWTPGVDGKKRAVMVFMHGGGFVTGTGNISWYDGTRLAAKRDIVFVTLNYRLNIFGFLDLAAIDPGYAKDANAALQDVVAALRWVHDNIHSFGGDPDNVTLMGQSAGAQIAVDLMASPAAKGLFRRVIAESPPADAPAAVEQAAGQAHAALAQLGIKETDLAALSTLPWDQVIKGFAGNGPWIDGTVLPAGTTLATAPSLSPRTALIIGWNRTENTFFEGPAVVADLAALTAAITKRVGDPNKAAKLVAAYAAEDPKATPDELYFRIAADFDFGRIILDAAARKSKLFEAPTYVYRFDGSTEVRHLMTPHTLEIGYALDNLAQTAGLAGIVTPDKQALADKVSAAWASFAKTGRITAGLEGWLPYDATIAPVLDIDAAPSLRRNKLAALGG